MTVRSRDHGRRRFSYFVCSSYDRRGTTVCANGLLLPMREADEAILTRVSSYVLNPEIVEGAIADAVRALRPSRDAVAATRAALVADVRRLEDEQARFVTAIAVAGQVDALAEALRENERQRVRLRHELAAL